MATPEPPLQGEALLHAITAALVVLHERYHGRKPVSARSQLMGDDLIACVMGGIYTDVEKTLIELRRGANVIENRSSFQTAMRQRFIDEVERLSGRRVLTFVSQHSVGPDLEVELFALAPERVLTEG